MQLVNLTPHSLTLFTPQGVVELPASGQLARVRSTSEPAGEVLGMPVVRSSFEPVSGLPAPELGKCFVVSSLVLAALRAEGVSRNDLLAPGTGPNDGAVRNSTGQVVGVTRLVAM